MAKLKCFVICFVTCFVCRTKRKKRKRKRRMRKRMRRKGKRVRGRRRRRRRGRGRRGGRRESLVRPRRVNIDPVTPPTVAVTSFKMSLCLLNLVLYTIKYTSQLATPIRKTLHPIDPSSPSPSPSPQVQQVETSGVV